MKLYFAPIAHYSNAIYRHMMLKYGADFVFSELILSKKLEKEIENRKFDFIKGDEDRTIWQIGVSDSKGIIKVIDKLIDNLPFEININMGCPHSTMKKEMLCGGILHDKTFMQNLVKDFVEICSKNKILPSAKIRIGIDENNIELEDYLDILIKTGIKKVYIHARSLRHPYYKPAKYEYLINIQKKYQIEIIPNGDIDSYDFVKEVMNFTKCDSIMIGRAALMNPFIFEDIKKEISYGTGRFNPFLKGKHNLKSGKKLHISNPKKLFIEEMLEIGEINKSKIGLIIHNLEYLLLGISGNHEILKSLKKADNFSEIKSIIKGINSNG